MFKQVILSIVGLLIFGSNAFALQWMNCSNADGSLKRVETEVWRANLVEWFYQGEKIVDAKESLNDAKKVVLKRDEVVEQGGRVVSVDEVFATQVIVSAGDDVDGSTAIVDFVICKSHEDDRRD